MPEESSAVAVAPATQEIHVSAPEGSGMAGTDFTESFAELEKAMGEETPPAPAKEPEAKPVKSKPAIGAEKNLAKAKEDTSTTGSEKSSAKDATEESTNGKPLPAPELRKAYQELKVKHAQLEKEYDTYKKTPREDPQAKTLAEKLAAAEKHRQQLDEELRHTAYERSQEFKDRYHTPFVNAYELATEVATQLQVTDAEGNVRQGTKEDFDALMQIADMGTAKKWAEEVYGPTGAAIILNQRMEVVKLARSRNAALMDAQKNAGEREKMRQEADMTQRKALAEKWSKLNNDAVSQYPNWFAPQEGDDKGNKHLEDGYKMADLAFSGQEMSSDKAIELHAWLRNRAAAWGREVYRNKQQAKRIAELESKLKEFEDSQPGPADGHPADKEVGELNWEAALEAQFR